MRLLWLCLFIWFFLSGCGSGYSVHGHEGVIRATGVHGALWSCDQDEPLFWIDHRIAYCNTKEECNKICKDLRDKQ